MKRTVLLQTVFWLIITGITVGFTSVILPLEKALLAALINLILFGITLYTNTLYIFPKFYSSEKISRYILINLLFIALLSFVFVLIEHSLFIDSSEFQRPVKRPWAMLYIRNFFWMVFLIMISSFYMIQVRLRKQEELSKKTGEEKLNTELKFLKSQINPHFLFNALNNIYSLSYLKSEKAPESILKLSAMLRYVIEDCKDETVTLKSEIQYIENYITFQKLKSEDDLNVLFTYKYINNGLKVSPLLFIPFVENSFKYSKIEEFHKAYINITFKTPGEDTVEFLIRNSVPPFAKAKPGAGTGIRNVKQRLKIMYPGKHVLDIKETEKNFEVYLKIDVS